MLVVGILAMVLLPTGVLAQAETPTVAPLDAAIQMYNDGKVDEALAKFKELHEAKPDDAAPAYWLAVAQLAQANNQFWVLAKGTDASYAAAAQRWQWWIGEAFKDMASLTQPKKAADTSVPGATTSQADLQKMIAATKWMRLCRDLAVSSDGAYLACRVASGAVSLVDLRAGRPMPLHNAYPGQISDGIALFFARSPDPVLASVARLSDEGEVRLLYCRSGDLICKITGMIGPYPQNRIVTGQYRSIQGLYALPGGRCLYELQDKFHVFAPDPWQPEVLLQTEGKAGLRLPAKDFGLDTMFPVGWKRSDCTRHLSRAIISQDGSKLLVDIEQQVPEVGKTTAWALYDITTEPRLLGICNDWMSQQRFDAVRQRYLLDGERQYPKLPIYAGGDVTLAFAPDYLEVADFGGNVLHRIPLSLLGGGLKLDQ